MSTTTLKTLPLMDEKARQELGQWMEQNDGNLPVLVKDMFSHYNILVDGLAGDQSRLRSTLRQLRRALGILPSSERRKNSGKPIDAMSQPGDAKPKNAQERLQLTLERSQKLMAWHRDLIKRYKRKIKDVKAALLKVEDIELTPEELADNEKENAQLMDRLSLGAEPDPALESPRQPFMQGGDVKLEEKTVEVTVKPDLLEGEEVLTRITDERSRYGFNLTVSKVTVQVEKLVLKDAESSTRMISASTRDIGPPKMDVTWEFLANMTIMVAQYAMPFNRLGSLLSVPDKRFTSAMLSRMFCYVARRFAPIYLHNFGKLANSTIFSGDDTSTKVVEFARYQKLLQADPNLAKAPPWLNYASRQAATESFRKELSPSLGVLLAKELGFEFDRKDGNGSKTSLQTTVISGRGVAEDPRSAIVFYRSHIGGFGNLLSIALGKRDPELKDLIIQSDLSTVNLVSNTELASRFNFKLAGCTSHARRPFALYEDDDPELCAAMLHFFKGLYIYENALDLHGRNIENVSAVRSVNAREMWEEIKELSEVICLKWSKATKLGAAARYILRHYPKLTAYLDIPQLSISNDFSERMLRMEKLIEANALFRNSLEGRFALDINRSTLQTGIAAHAPLQDYMVFVLRALPEEVEANPEAFTALNYTRDHQRLQ